ncbi:hypothetical protein GCM10020219_060420 [Nonomuraea dietziae]
MIAAIWNSSRNLRSVLWVTVTKNETIMMTIAKNALSGIAEISPRPPMSAGSTPRSGPGETRSARTYMSRPSRTSTTGSQRGAPRTSDARRVCFPWGAACCGPLAGTAGASGA